MTRRRRSGVVWTAVVATAIAMGCWRFLRSEETAGTTGATEVSTPFTSKAVRVQEPRARKRPAPHSSEEPDPDPAPAEDAPKPFRLTVHVTSAATGAPIAGGTVAVTEPLGPSEAVARTGADGTAVATVAAHRSVWFRVTAPGFVRRPWSGGGTATSPFSEDSAECESNAEEESVSLLPGLPLDGLVLDARSGAALGGARVHVEELREINEHFGGPPDDLDLGDAETASDGTFRLDVVPGKSTASVTVTAPGHAGEHRYVDPSDPRHLTFRLEPSGIVRGTVRGVDGSPAPGVEVAGRTTDDAEDSRSASAQTDAEGHFAMAGIALDRTYRVWAAASCDGTRSASTPREGIRLTIEAPEATSDLTLSRGSKLDVVLRAPDGTLVVKALFSVRMASVERFGSTDDEGHGVVEVTQPGPCRIVADVDGFLPCDVRVDVPEDATVRREVTLQRGLSLSGVVVDDTGAPVASALLDARR